jgi:hypothetical protein
MTLATAYLSIVCSLVFIIFNCVLLFRLRFIVEQFLFLSSEISTVKVSLLVYLFKCV